MTIFFLTIFHEEDTFEKDYISLRKQMIELEKIKENQQNLVVKEKELSPIMKRIKEISELSDISNVEEISEDKKKKIF